jgi:hypothetical protein
VYSKNANQRKMKKFTTISNQIIVNRPKSEVWDSLFTRFGEVNNFNPLIEGSTPIGEIQGDVGAERTCDITSKSKVRERISSVSGKDSFDIDIIEGGLPMMDEMKGTWNVYEIDHNRTRVVMDFQFTSKPGFMAPLLKGPMTKQLKGLTIGLKYHLETGGLVTKKNIKEIVRNYKELIGQASFKTQLVTSLAA